MPWQYTPYTVPMLLSGVVAAALMVFAWRCYSNPGRTSLVFLLLAVTHWSFAYALALAATDLSGKLLFSRLAYLGIVVVPVVWLLFALEYTGRIMPLEPGNLALFGMLGITEREEYLTRRKLALLGVVPAITLGLVATNDAHGLVWASTALAAVGSYDVLSVTYGPWFWVHTVYSYALLAIGTGLLVGTFVRSRHLYRGQTAAILLAAFVPWGGNALYLTGANPFPGLDPTPIAFAASGFFLVVALFRYRLLDVVPVAREVARDEVIGSMDDGVVVLSDENRIVDLNATAEGLIDRSVGDATGRPVAEVLPDLEPLLDPARGSDPTEVTLSTGREDRTYEVRISPVAGRLGYLAGRLVLLRDVTERERTEEHYRRLIEESTDVIAILDDDATIGYVSQATERVLGYAPEDLIGENPFDHVHPDDRRRAWERFADIVETGKTRQSAEFRFEHGDGSWVWLEARGRDLLDDRRVGGVVVYVRDISARKERERELERYEIMANRAADPAYSTDADGYLRAVNDAAASLVGRSREDLIGEHVSTVVDEASMERGEAAIRDLCSGDRDANSATFEVDLVAGDGERIRCETHVTLLSPDGSGSFQGTVGVIGDVVDREPRHGESEAGHSTTE